MKKLVLPLAALLALAACGSDDEESTGSAAPSPARDCVDQALQAMSDDGTLLALDEEWMQSGGEIPEITE